VSMFKRLGESRHLDDVAFAEIWSTAVGTGQPPAHLHLSACAQCRGRYATFVGSLDAIRDEANSEADEAFPAERLAAQHAQIVRRLEAAERPARVITFPRFGRPAVSTQGNAQRWVAAAAAAGLVIGLAAGQIIDLRPRVPVGDTVRAQPDRFQPPTPAVAVSLATVSLADEAILYGGDGEQRAVFIPALQPMDDITPRALDVLAMERRR
jgi:hypothetical protein